MVRRSVRIRLKDILTAIDEAAEFIDNADFANYQASLITRRAVERCVEIISEAVRHIPDEMTAKHPSIPWLEVKAIGNRLRHDYQRVDDLVMWRTATRSLPELRVVIAGLIAETETPL
jgi:uncharacterized protein with HEPN domain